MSYEDTKTAFYKVCYEKQYCVARNSQFGK